VREGDRERLRPERENTDEKRWAEFKVNNSPTQ